MLVQDSPSSADDSRPSWGPITKSLSSAEISRAKPREAKPSTSAHVEPPSTDLKMPASCMPTNRAWLSPVKARIDPGMSALACQESPPSVDTRICDPTPATARLLSAKSGASQRQFTGPSPRPFCTRSQVRPPSVVR